MKQWLFLILLTLAVIAALNRPVYSMPAIFSAKTDLENVNGWSSCNNIQSLSEEQAYSGKYSSKIHVKYASSYVFNLTVDRLPSTDVKRLKLKARIFAESHNVQLIAVARAHVGDQPPFIYRSAPVETEKGKWIEFASDFDFYWNFHTPDEISAFFQLTSDSGVVYVDDMEVIIY